MSSKFLGGHPPGSEEVSFEARDEGQAGSDDFVETAVVGEEEIDAGGCSDGEVQRIECCDSKKGAASGELVLISPAGPR